MTPALASPLAIPDYRRFFLARVLTTLGGMAVNVVLGWQVYDIARDAYAMPTGQAAFQLGLVGLAQFLPLLILTPVAGWVVDRVERRSVARFSNLLDLAMVLGLLWATAAQVQSLPLMFALAALHGVARAFLGPAMSSIGPNIVPPAILPKAIALNSIAWQGGAVTGPALGGLLYAVDARLPYLFAAGCLIVSAIALSLIRRVEPPAGERKAPVAEIADGLRYVGRHRFLLGAITVDLFAVLLGGATALLPVFARDVLHVGSSGLGYLRAAPAAGAVLVALVLNIRPLSRNVGVKMLGAVAMFGAATVVFGLSRSFALSMAALMVAGAADMLSVYVRSSLVQLHTPDAMRGRVSAASGLAISASNELGEMQSGTAAALLGPVGAVVFGGVGAIVVAGLWAWMFPELRRARSFAPPPHLS